MLPEVHEKHGCTGWWSVGTDIVPEEGELETVRSGSGHRGTCNEARGSRGANLDVTVEPQYAKLQGKDTSFVYNVHVNMCKVNLGFGHIILLRVNHARSALRLPQQTYASLNVTLHIIMQALSRQFLIYLPHQHACSRVTFDDIHSSSSPNRKVIFSFQKIHSCKNSNSLRPQLNRTWNPKTWVNDKD